MQCIIRINLSRSYFLTCHHVSLADRQIIYLILLLSAEELPPSKLRMVQSDINIEDRTVKGLVYKAVL